MKWPYHMLLIRHWCKIWWNPSVCIKFNHLILAQVYPLETILWLKFACGHPCCLKSRTLWDKLLYANPSVAFITVLWVEWLVWRESSVGPWDCLRCWEYLRKTSTNQNFQSSKACCSEKYYNTRYKIFVGQTRVIFTWGQLWPSGIVIACVCVCVYVCVCPSIITLSRR